MTGSGSSLREAGAGGGGVVQIQRLLVSLPKARRIFSPLYLTLPQLSSRGHIYATSMIR